MLAYEVQGVGDIYLERHLIPFFPIAGQHELDEHVSP